MRIRIQNMQYRRAYVSGGIYFFTVVTANRCPLFVDQANRRILREAFRKVRQQLPFRVDAIVLLPDHLHCIWTLTAGDADYPKRWRLIKTWFTKHCDQELRDLYLSDSKKNNPGIWQKRYWEHLIRDEEDYRRHVEYIHYNPVKHGYVQRPWDWAYSSFRRYVRSGHYLMDWGDAGINLTDEVGRK